jgi:two-component system response regulator DegU
VDKTRVLIIDEQTFYRAGLQQALSSQSDFDVSECDPLKDPLGDIESKLIDVVLLGAELVSEDGKDLCRRISRIFPNTRVIVLSAAPDDTELFEVMKIAAVAYLGKNAGVGEIADTIRRASHGEYPINDSLVTRPQVAGNVLKQFQSVVVPGAGDVITASLTKRETEILNQIANGKSNKQIAGLLEISEQTIKNHISSILRKLNANDRAHAVVLAIKHGWISVEDHPFNATGR